jgi:tetratricopeptide (TPR) repeat protein
MRKTFFVIQLSFLFFNISFSQQKATVKEYKKTFTTYPFSDPDPVPEIGKIYPYYRFDGYTDKPIQKEWKVVELENDYIKVMILPEIGGKIWTAIEKSTGKPFIYYNHSVKFRDVAMRGPWTSGGLEANYGIIGHTPNCATPVDYTTIEKADGSVSCIIGVLDLLTRTSWRIDINLQKDKGYFTTTSFWYNGSLIEQPYYTWMNTGIKAKGNLEFIYPGTKYLGHEGEYNDWPINKQNGKNISFYENNNFGTYKSYHVFGKYTDFFGGYWHDDDFGMGRYSTHDDKAGKKIWIWGLSQQGMIWERLLTDTDGQYVEVQSGRLFNQSAEGSTFTPFKHKGFLPHTTDVWTEYWFPVLKTKGFVAANNYGALNVKKENGWLKIYFSPLQKISDELKITNGNEVVYSKMLDLKTLQVFADSIRFNSTTDSLYVSVGGDKLEYEASPGSNVLSRPVDTPKDFDWNSVQGLYLQGKEDIRQRFYPAAEEKLKTCLQKDPDYLPALTDYAMLMYRDMRYQDALAAAKKALSIDTYDPASNYYYGIINEKLGNIADTKDGFDIASLGMEYRSAAYTELSKIYFKETRFDKAIDYARKSIDFNHYAIDAYQILALTYRLQNDHDHATKILDTLLSYDQLNHFARFEKYELNNSAENKQQFVGMIRNEMPQQTFLELATWYYDIGRKDEAERILSFSPKDAEVQYWLAFLKDESVNFNDLNADLIFPFRPETAEVLKSLIKTNDNWLLKYHLALLQWSYNNIDSAKKLFEQCNNQPDYAPFYAARAKFEMNSDTSKVLSDLQHAMDLNKNDWRYGKALVNYYITQKQYNNALTIATEYYKKFPDNYLLGMLGAKALILNNQYEAANKILQTINILPNEGATDGRQLYEETQLMLALDAMQKKNYKQSLNYVEAAREWPENLGVGKPYENDVDERLEDWLAYQNYLKQKNEKAAQQMIDKIISFTNTQQKISPSANDLISAWAMQEKGDKKQGERFLQQQLEKYPNNKLLQWTINTYEGKNSQLSEEGSASSNYTVLQKWVEMQIQNHVNM